MTCLAPFIISLSRGVDPEFGGMEGSERIHGQWGWGERRGADFGGGQFCDGCFEGFPRGDGAKVPVKGCGVYFIKVGSAAEINPAGGVYFSEERGGHRQRKRT